MQRDIENVEIELCELDQYAITIRICPIESTDEPPSSNDIENIVASLEQQIVSLQFKITQNFDSHTLQFMNFFFFNII